MKRMSLLLSVFLTFMMVCVSAMAGDNVTWSGYARNNFQVGKGGRQGQSLHTGFGYRSRIQEGMYYESNLSTKLPKDSLFMLTLAQAGNTHNYDGVWGTDVAVRQLFLEMNNVADVKGLTLWFGNRYYRGVDYYPYDTWPFDNLNVTGGGVGFGDKFRQEVVVAARKDLAYTGNTDATTLFTEADGYTGQRMIYSYKGRLNLSDKEYVKLLVEQHSVSKSSATLTAGSLPIKVPSSSGLRVGLEHNLKYTGGANNTIVEYAVGDVFTDAPFSTPAVEVKSIDLQNGTSMSGAGTGVLTKKNSKAFQVATFGDKDFGSFGTFYGLFYLEEWNTSDGNDLRGKETAVMVRPFFYATKRLNVGIEADYVDYSHKRLSSADVDYVQVAPMLEYSLHGKLWGWPKLKLIYSNAWYDKKVTRYGESVQYAYNLSAGFELVW